MITDTYGLAITEMAFLPTVCVSQWHDYVFQPQHHVKSHESDCDNMSYSIFTGKESTKRNSSYTNRSILCNRECTLSNT